MSAAGSGSSGCSRPGAGASSGAGDGTEAARGAKITDQTALPCAFSKKENLCCCPPSCRPRIGCRAGLALALAVVPQVMPELATERGMAQHRSRRQSWDHVEVAPDCARHEPRIIACLRVGTGPQRLQVLRHTWLWLCLLRQSELWLHSLCWRRCSLAAPHAVAVGGMPPHLLGWELRGQQWRLGLTVVLPVPTHCRDQTQVLNT